jgi:hypothetical protein
LPAAREKFNAATLAQLDLGASVSEQVRGKPIAELIPVINLCLDQDPQWRTVSRNAVVNAIEAPARPVDVATVHARKAFDLARARDYPGAASFIQEAISSCKDVLLKGYHQEILAEYVNEFDPPRAQEILLSAAQLNSHVTKPLAGVKYAKLDSPAKNQATAAVEFMRRFKSGNDLVLFVTALTEELMWNPEKTKAFESAVFELGLLLGFSSQRPELDTGAGPDNLWSLGNLSYVVIECKSGAISATISKSDGDQLSGAVNWFSSKYDKSCTAAPILIHPSFTFDKQAAPLDAVRIIDTPHLDALNTSLRGYAANISSSGSIRDPESVRKQLQHFGLNTGELLNRFSRRFVKP